MNNILALILKIGLLLSLRFLKISRGITTLHVMIKGSIQKEDITIIDINIYAPKVALVVKNPPASAEDARDAG